MSSYYPIFINIKDKPVLVVGGGMVAYRKVSTLLEYGAQVRIVSPKIIPELEERIDGVHCCWVSKEYSKEDIRDAVLVFSCTEKEAINIRVAEDANASQRLVNVIDDQEKCSFFVPAIMRQGDLTIAISTAGSSPLVASRIKKELSQLYGEEMEVYLNLLRFWRKEIKTHLPLEKRREFWEKVTNGQAWALIKAGELDKAGEEIQDCFRSLLEDQELLPKDVIAVPNIRQLREKIK